MDGNRDHWPLVAAATALIGASWGLGRYAYGLYLPTLRGEFGIDASAAGRIASLSYGSYGLALVAGAALSDRGRARHAAVLGGLCAALGTGAISLAGSATVLGVGVAIGGASTGLSSPAAFALIAATVPARARDRAQSLANAGTGFGIVVCASSALPPTHWRLAFVLFAALSVAVSVGIAASAGRADPVTASPRERRGARPSHPPRAILPLVAGAFGIGAAASAYWTFGRDLIATAGATASTGAALWLALGLASILAAATGDLLARYRFCAVWATLAAALAVSTAGLTLAPHALPIGLASAALFGAGFIALTAILIMWAARLDPHRSATAVSATLVVLSIGGLAGAAAAGAVVDHAGFRPAFLLAAGIALICAPLAYTPAARHAFEPVHQDDVRCRGNRPPVPHAYES